MVMTPRKDFLFFKSDVKVIVALEKMDRYDHDVAPVTKNGDMQWFVEREDLRNSDPFLPLRDVAKNISVKHIISEQTKMVDLLGLLAKEEFFFVIGKKELTGIVTCADLNKRPVKMLFYLLISELEARLVDMIKCRFPRIKDSLQHLRASQRTEIEEIHKGSKQGNSEISIEEYFTTSDVMTIVERDEPLRKQLQYKSREQAEKNLDPIIIMRNTIMHPRSLIADKKEAQKLKQRYDTITDLLKTICENTEANDNKEKPEGGEALLDTPYLEPLSS
jgi:hypothetical protein